ncbi:hypothetical protein B0H19DRAFT_1377049 [Mycena capillaripes]|nr:hypothetical protein B0H19DRAFT_1377049 [Mycena capillaripes]
MLYKLLTTTVFAILVMSQGVISAPQIGSHLPCGESSDPHCPTGESCCIPFTSPPTPTGFCARFCPL